MKATRQLPGWTRGLQWYFYAPFWVFLCLWIGESFVMAASGPHAKSDLPPSLFLGVLAVSLPVSLMPLLRGHSFKDWLFCALLLPLGLFCLVMMAVLVFGFFASLLWSLFHL